MFSHALFYLNPTTVLRVVACGVGLLLSHFADMGTEAQGMKKWFARRAMLI